MIKGSDTILYFSHDYYSNVEDKNKQLIKTAKLAKSYNVKSLIAVTPIEFINFQTMNIVDSPLSDLNNTHKEVLDKFNNSTIIKTDLVFGSNSYFIKFLIQSWAQSYSYFNNDNYKHFKFNPIHFSDLNEIINSILENSTSYNGKKFIANGKESLSFVDIDNLIRQAYCPSGNFQLSNENLKKIIESWQMFFHGNTHMTNFSKMLNFLQGKEYFKDDYESITDVISLKTKPFREYYSHKAEKFSTESTENLIIEKEDENIKYPNYTSYWQSHLN